MNGPVVLVRLESKQQALIFGYAVPVPVAVRTREYGTPEFYASLSRFGTPEGEMRRAEEIDELCRKQG
ncbi:MAG: hypothetical protein Q8O40_09710 [Chloroflexota bacterium]|nr:hypothetical protein [Chloroflexota bacterium]